jgi:hypothetical protein
VNGMPDKRFTTEDDRLFRIVTALGAELRRQGALDAQAEPKFDLIDLAYAAIAAAERRGPIERAENNLDDR